MQSTFFACRFWSLPPFFLPLKISSGFSLAGFLSAFPTEAFCPWSLIISDKNSVSVRFSFPCGLKNLPENFGHDFPDHFPSTQFLSAVAHTPPETVRWSLPHIFYLLPLHSHFPPGKMLWWANVCHTQIPACLTLLISSFPPTNRDCTSALFRSLSYLHALYTRRSHQEAAWVFPGSHGSAGMHSPSGNQSFQ